MNEAERTTAAEFERFLTDVHKALEPLKPGVEIRENQWMLTAQNDVVSLRVNADKDGGAVFSVTTSQPVVLAALKAVIQGLVGVGGAS